MSVRALLPLLLGAALAGCPSVGPREWDAVRDQDGDGGLSVRFGGRDCLDDDPAIADCDADRDGFRAAAAGGDDCDDADATVFPREMWRDLDADGFGDPGAPLVACEAGALVAENDLDCDDDDDRIHPGSPETCDDLDRNCDGDPYLDAPGTRWWKDLDGDGHGRRELADEPSCLPGPDEAATDDDCDDGNDQVYPGADEVWYDGADADCDGGSDYDQDGDGQDSADAIGGPDCDDLDADVFVGAPEACNGRDDDCDDRMDDEDRDEEQVGQLTYHRDGDGDGFGGATVRQYCSGAEPTGWVLFGDDCDDLNRAVRPGAAEQCNGRDDDCNGVVDDNPVDGPLGYDDTDQDGWGDAAVGRFCGAPPAGVATRDGDCDDTDPARFPGAPEVCHDGVRQDCDPGPADDCDLDQDPDATDCADDDPARHAGAPEVCNGVDDDCDGLTDGADPSVDPDTERLWYLDLDGDGFGSVPLAASCTPPGAAVDNGLDCDDTDDQRSPGADERCDGRDQDCDGEVDETPVDAPTFWLDLDGDGAGDPAAAVSGACTPPDGPWVDAAGDCAPADPAVRPGAQETCDGIDNDCDGATDDQDTEVAGGVWFEDADGDGYGLDADRLVSCGAVPGRTLSPGDCDDGDDEVHPGAPERCNAGRDDDCDGAADGDDAALGLATWYADADGDGFGDPDDPSPVTACAAPNATAANAADCDDGDAGVNPRASEVCDPADVDEDCDGLADDDDPSTVSRPRAWEDLDGDGVPGTPAFDCDAGPTPDPLDCLDTSAAVRPGAPFDACNGLDDDCDGTVDFQVEVRTDADGDGYGVAGTESLVGCFLPPGVTLAGDERAPDCNDDSAVVHPDFPYEICDDGLDNDCDGALDALDGNALGCADDGGGSPGAPEVHLYWPDLDGDGLGDPDAEPVSATAAPPAHVANALDCAPATPDPLPVALATAAQVEAVFAAPTALPCQPVVLAPGLFSAVDVNTPANGGLRRYLVGPLDGADGRAVWEGASLVVDHAFAAVFASGIDLVPVASPQDDLPVRVTAGLLGLADALLADGGLQHTGGDVVARRVTVDAAPVGAVAGRPSAWQVSLAAPGDLHEATSLAIVDADGPLAMAVTAGTFRDLTVRRSGRVEVRPALVTGAVLLEDGALEDCLGDCLTLDPGPPQSVTVRRVRLLRAAERGLEVASLGGSTTLEHLTVVGAGTVGLDAAAVATLSVARSIVWGSGGADLDGGFDLTATLFGTTAPLARVFQTLQPPAPAVPGFQSHGARLDGARWDLHLAPVPDGLFGFRGGEVGAFPRTTDPWYADADGDGLPDGWELARLGTLSGDGRGDADGDGLPDDAEYAAGTWPDLPDTDGDGFDDGADAAPLDEALR